MKPSKIHIFFPQRKKAFTLVELIIVITILAILATIAFVSFQGYSAQSRDSNRVATVKNIENGVNIFITKTGKVPEPDDIVGIGEINNVKLNMVGKVGSGLVQAINMNEIPRDPKVQELYRYGIDLDSRYFQVGLTLESDTATFAYGTIQSYASSIHVAKVSGNYDYPLYYRGKIYTLPSLLFLGSGSLTNTSSFIVDRGECVPYTFGGPNTCDFEVGEALEKVTGATGLVLNEITAPDMSACEFKQASGSLIPPSFEVVAESLGISDKNKLGVALYGKSYFNACGGTPSTPKSDNTNAQEVQDQDELGHSNSFHANSLSTGEFFTVLIGHDKKIYTWGAQLGIKPYSNLIASPTLVSDSLTFKSVTAGSDFACGLTESGKAYCWGENGLGQLGNNSYTDSTTLVPVNTEKTFVSISSGYSHTCALSSDGKGYCWGQNNSAQLGNGNYTNQNNPSTVSGAVTYINIQAGGNFTCGLAGSGSLYCWGATTEGQLGSSTSKPHLPSIVTPSKTYTTFDTGFQHACAIDTGGQVWCWGWNEYGQVGNNNTSDSSISFPIQVFDGAGFKSISTGMYHTCGIKNDNTSYCWGSNSQGQLGINTNGGEVAKPNRTITTESFQSLSGGGYHTCGISTDGNIFCWGKGEAVGDGTNENRLTPQVLGNFVRFKSIQASHYHTCGIGYDTHSYCWGSNGSNQLGVGTGAWRVSTPEKFAQISSMDLHTCALNTSKQAYCWGENGNGRLGNNTTTDSSIPVAVTGGLLLSQIAIGYGHSCGLTLTGEVYCWGSNTNGELGIGQTAPPNYHRLPQSVTGNLTFQSITSGYKHICGLSSGKAYCWGENDKGQVGNSNTGSSTLAPTEVNGDLTFSQIIAGWYHTCGLDGSGKAYCWGWNTSGQLGNNTSIDTYSPQEVATIDRYVQLVAGKRHTCGLKSDGSAYCWGENGMLGNQLSGDKETPSSVTGSILFSNLTAGESHTCGISSSNGSIYCWGSNPSGHAPFGIPSPTSSNIPIQVNY